MPLNGPKFQISLSKHSDIRNQIPPIIPVVSAGIIMARVIPSILLIILILTITFSFSLSQDETEGNNVQDVCKVTRYRELCIRSLTPFANTAKHSPSRWARAGVSVSIGEAKKVSQYLYKLERNKRGNVFRGRNRVALSDCVETIQETLDNLHKALYVLRKISIDDFISQIEDVTTWVSAAETDEETCLDGFEGQNGKHVKSLKNLVLNVRYLTSNALALVNKLATTGPEIIVNEEKLT